MLIAEKVVGIFNQRLKLDKTKIRALLCRKSLKMWIWTALLSIFGLLPSIQAHYRRMAVDNTDLCEHAFIHKPISIGTG